jgi:hypothetical protein
MNFTILISINKYDGEEKKRTEQSIANLPPNMQAVEMTMRKLQRTKKKY